MAKSPLKCTETRDIRHWTLRGLAIASLGKWDLIGTICHPASVVLFQLLDGQSYASISHTLLNCA